MMLISISKILKNKMHKKKNTTKTMLSFWFVIILICLGTSVVGILYLSMY